jgi:sugar phosphate permease
MQQLADLDANADCVDLRPSRKRKASPRRKVTVRLSEGVCGRLDVATDRPGVGKSMLVEAALEHFLNPAPSVEALMRERLDDMHARFDRLEHNVRTIAETIALHAQYQLAVAPAVSQERQKEAILLGEERFKILAEQVDRRVRQCRPLMQETIDSLNSRGRGRAAQATGEEAPQVSEPQNKGQKAASECFDFAQGVSPGEGGSSSRGNRHHCASSLGARGNLRQNSRPIPPNSNPNLRGESDVSRKASLSTWRLILSVFLPFAAGYYLAYLFRTINAAISPALASDFGLDAADTGLLASVYFLVFGLTQIPIGVLLDRLGPRRVQGVLLVIAAGGATLFGNASSFPELLVARGMIGLGVAGSLMAGLKTIVTWFPRERVALANGWMIMLGSLGAVTATAPTDWLLNYIGWRSLFEILTIGTFTVAGLIYMVVPERAAESQIVTSARKPLTLWSIYSDPRFLRVAPLSAACIGSSWALQSLWAAAWLTDVEGFDHHSRATQMFLMAVGLSLGALLLGAMADRLRKCNIRTEVLLAGVGALFIVAELALVLRIPLPSLLPWSVVSIAGAATVLSFAVIADYFPKEFAARANGALNLLHFGWAFTMQYGIGLVVEQWPSQDGHYPVAAYQAAFGLSLALQAATLTWFAVPWLRSFVRQLYLLFAPLHAGPDDQLALVATAAEGAVLETSQGVEW